MNRAKNISTWFLFCIILTLFRLQAFSTHIVGGEIEILHKRSSTYQIQLKMYSDHLNGKLATEDQVKSKSADVYIFEKNNPSYKKKVTLPLQKVTTVDYGEKCTQQETVETWLLLFYEDVVLLPEDFQNPAGYYIVWENCCRNGVIENIVDPVNEGMAFYTEFPALMQNGQRFINSSPHFYDFTGDFPCKNKPFTLPFGAVDFNGDSLVYSLSTPLAGHIGPGSFLNPYPAPYQDVIWNSGYSTFNQIPGAPAFNINSKTGVIQFTPTVDGLFVIGIQVDEYRNGQKIGMVKRDFQFLITNCPNNEPVQVDLKLPDGTFYNSFTDTLKVHLDQDTCFSLAVSDKSTVSFNETENVNIKVLPNLLPAGILTLASSVTVNPATDTTYTNLCLSACNLLYLQKDTLFKFTIVVSDNKCPKTLQTYDTLNIILLYQTQANATPIIGSIPNGPSFSATVNKPLSFDIYGKDADADDLINITAQGLGFNLEDKGMSFSSVSGKDSIGSRFTWQPRCEDLEQQLYTIRFIVDDNSCMPDNKDTIDININLTDTSTNLPSISPTNLFTPNGDNKNDFFEIPNIAEGNCEFYFKTVKVYNRWGGKIFESNNPHFKWDGGENASGLYFYIIDINKKEIKGWIQLVR